MHAVVLYSACHNIMFTVSQQSTNTQVWYWLAVSLEEMLVSLRKSPSHALLKELFFSGEMKHLERRPCTTQVHHSPWGMSLGQKLSATINQSCLVSSLSFQATASRNGTTVTCTNRDRNSSQSLSLQIVSSELQAALFVCILHDQSENNLNLKC